MKKKVLISMKRKSYNVAMIFKKIMKNEKTRVNRTVLLKNQHCAAAHQCPNLGNLLGADLFQSQQLKINIALEPHQILKMNRMFQNRP